MREMLLTFEMPETGLFKPLESSPSLAKRSGVVLKGQNYALSSQTTSQFKMVDALIYVGCGAVDVTNQDLFGD
jgi:hypothetical protein